MAQFWVDDFWVEGFWVDNFWLGLAAGGGGTPAPSVKTKAANSSKARTRYAVELQGQTFMVESRQEAEQIMAQVRPDPAPTPVSEKPNPSRPENLKVVKMTTTKAQPKGVALPGDSRKGVREL